MIDNYKIPKEKIHQIVHDNAANMINGVELTGFSSLSCFLHTTQLGLQDVIFTQPSVEKTIKKCRNIATHFNKSSG